MHNAVIHGQEADLSSPLKTPQERALEARALHAIAEYRLVKRGVATYQQLGYRLPGDDAPEIKLLEFLMIDGAFNKANQELARRREERQRRLWRR